MHHERLSVSKIKLGTLDFCNRLVEKERLTIGGTVFCAYRKVTTDNLNTCLFSAKPAQSANKTAQSGGCALPVEML